MRDLFGEVVVTLDDLDAWVAALAPGFASSDRRRAHYIRAYDVASKVRYAKLTGTFESTIENARARRAFLARRLGIPES